jgi:hypothetical protein
MNTFIVVTKGIEMNKRLIKTMHIQEQLALC